MAKRYKVTEVIGPYTRKDGTKVAMHYRTFETNTRYGMHHIEDSPRQKRLVREYRRRHR